MSILEAKDISYSYPDGTKALRNINIKIEKGKMISLLGPNGAGKSTLFLHFNGIIKPSEGKIKINNEELKYDKKSLLSARQKVGLVFQNPDDQLFAPTVFEDVSFGPMNMKLDDEEIKQRVNESLEKVGMLEYAKKAPHHLSGGQKKRVAIAGILAMKPEIMVFDEPTSGLDPKGASDIMKLLYNLNKEGITIIISTHDVDLVPIYSDTVHIINKGQIIKTGTCEEVFEDIDTIRNMKLRLPRITHLFEILHKRDKKSYSTEKYPLSELHSIHLSPDSSPGSLQLEHFSEHIL